MADWDYCRIVLAPEHKLGAWRRAIEDYRRWSRHRLVFRSRRPTFNVWWEAKLDTVSGFVIDKSPAFDIEDKASESHQRSALVIRLIRAGWEPVPGSLPGKIERLRRPLPPAP